MFRRLDEADCIEDFIGAEIIWIYEGENELFLRLLANDDPQKKKFDECLTRFIFYMLFDAGVELTMKENGREYLIIEFTIHNEEIFQDLKIKFDNKEFS